MRCKKIGFPHALIKAILSCSIAVSAGQITSRASAEPIIAVGGFGAQVLVTFDSASPGAASTPIPITGTGPFVTFYGIDVRPTTAELFAIESSARTLWTINPATGAATLRASLSADPADTTNPFSGIVGWVTGMDFDPIADAAGAVSLRVTTVSNQNLRVDVNTGLVITDDNIMPIETRRPSLSDVAYANNDVNPVTATALYGINLLGNTATLLRSTNPNLGSFVPQGSLGRALPSNQFVGFDISGTASAFVSQSGFPSTFYEIDLTTGAARLIGSIDSVDPDQPAVYVRAIAAQPARAVPEPTTLTLVALGGFAFYKILGRRNPDARGESVDVMHCRSPRPA